jgi:hypothetical protein
MKKFISLFLTSLLLVATIGIISSYNQQQIYAQSSEQNEKQMECWDYKGPLTAKNPNAFLINCLEYVQSDYDNIEEFVEKEHPELDIKP